MKYLAWFLILFGGLGAASLIGSVSVNPSRHNLQTLAFALFLFIVGVFILRKTKK